MAYTDYNSAFGCAVKFGNDKPGHFCSSCKLFCLLESVLPRLTSQPNQHILEFAAYLNEKKVDMWIRHVVVPGITDDDKYLYDLGYFIGQFDNLKALDVLPYHTMGEAKYKKLGIDYKLAGVPAMDKDKVVEKKKVILEGVKKRRAEQN